MLVQFAVHPECVSASHDSADDLAAHRRFIGLWQRFGVLALTSNEAIDPELHAAIERLPVAVRKLWREALQRERRVGGRPQNLSNVRTVAELEKLAAYIDLACVDDESAAALGIRPSDLSYRPPFHKPEVTRFRVADQSQTFEAVQRLAERSISTGEAPEKIWRERFAGFASVTKHVAVVDRYALKEDEIHQDRSGLRFVLRKLSDWECLLDVTVFIANVSRSSVDAITHRLSRIQQAFGARRGYRLEFRVGDDERFGRLAHGRYIRFDRSVCVLDVGLEVFREPAVTRRCEFALRRLTEDITRVESALRSISKAYR